MVSIDYDLVNLSMSPVDKRRRWRILTLVAVVIIIVFCVQQYRSHKEHELCNALCEGNEDKESCFSNCLDEIKRENFWKIIPFILNENI